MGDSFLRRWTCTLCIFCIAQLARAQNGDLPLTYSNQDTDKTPKADVQFRGPFWNDTLTISAQNLPRHEFVEIEFDLLMLRSWDGFAELAANRRPTGVGPDYFRMAIVGGPTLIYATFSNIPNDPAFRAVSRFQNYPSQVPGDRRIAQTGAKSANTLGYHYPWPGPPQIIPMDAIYHIRFMVPHQDSKVAIEMAAMNLQNIIDESWGIRDMHVRAIAPGAIKPPDQAVIAAAFADALNPDIPDPSEAFQTLIKGGDDATWWLKTSLVPKPIDGEEVKALIKAIGADDTGMAERDATLAALVQMGPQVEPYLRDARRTAVGEQRLRIDWVLGAIAVTPITDDDVRKVMLATRVLEIIGTPKALEARRQLVQK